MTHKTKFGRRYCWRCDNPRHRKICDVWLCRAHADENDRLQAEHAAKVNVQVGDTLEDVLRRTRQPRVALIARLREQIASQGGEAYAKARLPYVLDRIVKEAAP
jgi:hypothetical protein